MATIQEEIAALEKAINEKSTSESENIERIKRIREMVTTPEDEAILEEFVSRQLDDIEKSISEMEEAIIRYQLGEVMEIVNLSYIAKKYFGRSQSWLSQRINGCIVNGKRASFTENEIQTLKSALSDIANIINSSLERISLIQ